MVSANNKVCLCMILWVTVLTRGIPSTDAFVTVTPAVPTVSRHPHAIRILLPIGPLHSMPPSRQPRRNLQKRNGRGRQRKRSGNSWDPQNPSNDNENKIQDSQFWEIAESRPIISARSKELGEDYWIEEAELLKQQQEQTAARLRRQEAVGQIPDEKLWSEILGPYKQNWIGFISVFIIVIAVIVKEFPELLNYPVIRLPDL